ncbi:hypothetical protein [Ornithinimicrobium sp. W1665]|uniref:hypothetical protein n=1 Tax=Ornithinimicrobium sp. W1665 TaxID=3416666 RepID=UPI003CEA9358
MRVSTRPQSPPSPVPVDRAARSGARVALATGALTLITFALALTALPDRVPYPFTDEVIAAQWPGDYLWMYPAMVLMVLFVALVATVHERTAPERRVHSLLAVALAAIAAGVLLVDYWVQVTVLPVSLAKGQLDGWSMLTQYNPNGVFLALEELGYVLMSLALLSLVPALPTGTRPARVLRRLFVGSAVAVAVSFAVVTALEGPDRGDTFEILVISLVWLTLLVASPLLALVLRSPKEHA